MAEAASSSRATRLGLALLGFVAFGATHALLGTGWEAMREDFSQPLGRLGTLTAVSAGAYGAAAVLSGRIARRHGTGGLLASSYALVVLGLLGVACAPGWRALVAATALLGVGHGWLDPALNAYVARSHGVSVMNLLHAAFGLGASLGPLAMVWAVEGLGNWRLAYAALLCLSVALLAATFLTRASWGVASSREPAARPGGLSSVAVGVVALGFLFAVGVETATAQWAFSILREGRGLSPERSAGFVSGFWVGLTLGRLAGVAVGRRVTAPTLLVGSAGVALLGLSLLSFGPAALSSWGLPLGGAGLALAFPSLVVVTTARFGDRADAVIGYGCGAASLGSALLPWWLGRVAETDGASALAPWLWGFGVSLLIAGVVAARRRH